MISAPAVTRTPCPACTAPMVELVYAQPGVPVSSNRVFHTREEAIACDRGDIRLAFCHSCGFIANTTFEPALAGEDCETSQAGSARFRDYATGLARGWIEAHGLRGQTVLEIGSGRGEFLGWMRECGIGRGIAVDPMLAGGSDREADARGGIQWVADHYRGEYLAPDVRAIVCRHTLEHIGDCEDFVTDLRRSIGDQELVVLVEVPDALTILQGAAFWDIYYEHCAYFTRGSLARLFARAGFDVLRVRRVYDDQYLVLEAHPSHPGQPGQLPPMTDDRPHVWRAVTEFRRKHAHQRERLERLFTSFASREKRVVLWGAGSKATAYLGALGLGDRVECVVDINPRKQGTFIAGTGHAVVGPEALQEVQPDVVVMMNDIYRDEIAATLEAHGVEAELMGTRDR